MDRNDIEYWTRISNKILKEVHHAVDKLVGLNEGGEIVGVGADGTPTKRIDYVAEKKVFGILEATGRPLDLVSEELGMVKIGEGPSEVIFVIDPLDGTNNAIRNIPSYGISVALADKTKQDDQITIQDIELAFVKNFATNEAYYAIRKHGAFINGKPLYFTKKNYNPSLKGSYIHSMDINCLKKINGCGIRVMGALALELCYVADGTYQAFIESRKNLRIIDIAAAKLIIEESGGVITDFQGNKLNNNLKVYNRTSLLASNDSSFYSMIKNLLTKN